VIGEEISGGGWGNARAGAVMLVLAADPSNRDVLRSVADGPVEWSPDQIARILPTGEEVLFITFVIEQWLQKAPGGAMDIDGPRAKKAIPALAAGWSASIVHALAVHPRTVTELEREIEGLGPAALRRRLEAMREAGLVEARPSDGEGALYAVTDFLRAAIAPLAAGARFEHRYAPADTPGIKPLDAEAAFLLSLPLLRLPREVDGLCRLVVKVPVHGDPVPTGAMARVEHGEIAAVSTELREECDALLEGPPTAWLDAVIDPLSSRLYPEGDEDLAAALLVGLHEMLFGLPVQDQR
jgi:DNA-binding HxlR family transcriptional regulator